MPTEGNPYIDLLYAQVRERGWVVDAFTRRRLLDPYDVVHVNWPAALVRWHTRRAWLDVAKVLGLLRVARARGARLVWTAHDLQPHDVRRPTLFAFFFMAFRRQVDLVVHLTESAEGVLIARYPDLATKPSMVVPHGHYRDVYDVRLQQDRCRDELGLPQDAKIALLVGQIRAYKQVPDFMRAMDAAGSPLHLAVAGECRDPRLRAEVEQLGSNHPLMHLRLASLSKSELSAWVRACDVLVLPYAQASALHSGVAMLGLSHDRPVVVAPMPPMRDLQQAVGEQWVWVTDGGLDEAVRLAARAVDQPDAPDSPNLSAFDWPEVGRLLIDAFQASRTGKMAH